MQLQEKHGFLILFKQFFCDWREIFQRFDIVCMEATSRCKPLVFSGLETALWGCSCYHGIFFEKNGKKGLTRGIDF